MKNNIYYIAYQMLMDTLEEDDINECLNKLLEIIKSLYNSKDTVVFIKEENEYNYFIDSNTKDSLLSLSILNNTKDKIENEISYDFKIPLDNLNNILYIPIIGDDRYVLSVINPKTNVDNNLLNIIKNTLNVILKRVKLLKILQTKSYTDTLTGLSNRNYYEEQIKLLDLKDAKYVYAIFDLFRLKYLNDNYSHALGDEYIISASKILNKYFGSDSLESRLITSTIGSTLYRVGGDEFILITDVDDESLVNVKAKLAAFEIANLNLGEDLILGLNYGIASRYSKESVKELYIEADKSLIKDKDNMYKVLGLTRRR